jgi:hypothetical protein
MKGKIQEKKTTYKQYSIRWIKTNYSEISSHEDYYFYGFSRGKTLLYIGNTIKQDVKDRIDQHIRIKFKNETHGLQIWLGVLSYSHIEKVSDKLIRDLESLIIFRNQPSFNHQCKKNYTGNGYIMIHNVGMPLLKKRIHFNSNE